MYVVTSIRLAVITNRLTGRPRPRDDQPGHQLDHQPDHHRDDADVVATDQCCLLTDCVELVMVIISYVCIASESDCIKLVQLAEGLI